MATIANLLVRIAADNSQLRSALARSATDLNRFARNLNTTSRNFGNFGAVIPRRVQQVVDRVQRMERAFGQASTRIRRDFENLTISRSQFERQGREAGIAFRTAIMREVNRLEDEINSGVLRRGQVGVNRRLQAGLLARIPRGLDIDPQHLNNQLLAVSDVAESAGRVMTRALTLPLVGFGLAAAKSAADFEKSFNAVRAVTSGSAQQIADLREEALRLGQTKAFDPGEIAQGMAVLGQAGLKAQESLRAIGPLLNIATIEGQSLDDATKILIHTMAQFGLTSREMGENAELFADKLVAASLSGTVNLTELGHALNYAGTISNQTGQDFNTVLAILTKLGQAGLTASVGGTSLRNMIARLATVTPQAQRQLDELARKTGKAAVNFRNAKGGFKSLLDILIQLGKEGQNIDVGDIFKIFNLRAGPGFAALSQMGAKDIADLAVKIENARGEAERIARIKFSGLSAEIQRLSGSFQALAVSIGDSGMLRFLTNMVSRFREFIQEAAGLSSTVLRLAVTFGIFVAVIGPAISLIATVIRGIVQLRVAAFLLTGSSALGGLAAMLAPGGVLTVGLIALGLLLAKVAGDALEAEIALAKLATRVSGMSDMNLNRMIIDTETRITSLQARIDELNAKPITLAAKGDDLSTETKENIAQIQKWQDEIDDLKKRLAVMQKARGENAARTEEENRLLAEQEKKWKDIQDRLSQLPGFTENIFSAASLKGLTKETNNIAASLRNAIEQAKGLEDREERLVDPLTQAAEQLNKVKAIMAQIDPSKLPSGLANAATELERLIKVGQAPDPLAGQDLIRNVDELLARMEAVRDSTEDVDERAQRLAPLIQQAAQYEADLEALIESQGGLYRANNKLLQARNRLLRQVPTDPLTVGGLENFGGRQVRDLAFRAREAQAAMEQAAPDTDAWERARLKMVEIEEELFRVRQMFIFALRAAGLSPAEALQAWEEFKAVFDDIRGRIGDADDSMERLLDSLDGVRNGVAAFRDLADAIGIVSDSLDLALQGIDKLIGGIQEVVAAHEKVKDAGDGTEKSVLNLARAIPGIIGVIAGGVNALKGLGELIFGSGAPTATEKLQQENTRALLDLTAALEAQTLGLAGTGEISVSAGRLQDLDLGNAFEIAINKIEQEIGRELRGFEFAGAMSPERFNEGVIEEINRMLEGTGLTFADLKKKADELGISLFDEKGFLNPAAFEILAEAAAASAEALRHFSDTIDNQLRQLDVISKLQGPEGLTDTAQLANQTKVLFDNLGQGALSFVEGINTTTEEGRQQMRAALLRLIEAIQSGALGFEAFGKFESADDLLEFIDRYADSLNALDEATQEATKSMANVPAGFKIDLARFTAQDFAEPPPAPGRELGDALEGPFGPLNDNLVELNETSETGFRDLIATLQTLLGAPETAGGTPEGAPGDFRSVDSLLAALSTAAEGMAPEIQKMIDVLTEIVATEAAASMRGFQETLTRRAEGDPFDAGMQMRRSDGGMVQFNFGEIHITGADKTAREQWRDIKRVARDEAKSKFGDTRRWGEVP
jgi:TP901 family phage tail tape measure protein